MGHITADEGMADHLRGLLEPVEVRDGEGKLLGHYTPHVPPELLALYAESRSSFNLEEIKRRASEGVGTGSSFEEMWKRIQERVKQG